MSTLAGEVLMWHSLPPWFCYKWLINNTSLYTQATITMELRANFSKCLSVHSLKYKLTFGLRSVQFIAQKDSNLVLEFRYQNIIWMDYFNNNCSAYLGFGVPIYEPHLRTKSAYLPEKFGVPENHILKHQVCQISANTSVNININSGDLDNNVQLWQKGFWTPCSCLRKFWHLNKSHRLMRDLTILYAPPPERCMSGAALQLHVNYEQQDLRPDPFSCRGILSPTPPS